PSFPTRRSSDLRHRTVAERAEVVGDGGGEVRAAGDAAEEEVPDDGHLPAGDLEHHSPPFPRSRKASMAPTPTRMAEPMESSESTTTLRCGSLGCSGRLYVAGRASSRKN